MMPMAAIAWTSGSVRYAQIQDKFPTSSGESKVPAMFPEKYIG